VEECEFGGDRGERREEREGTQREGDLLSSSPLSIANRIPDGGSSQS